MFSGIEAASLAWKQLGWECVAFSEIEKHPCSVLAHHYPDVPNLGDITQITQQQIESLGHVDAVVFGFPCQDLSQAGKRAGLETEEGEVTRSGLFYTAMRIVRWSKARWAIAENVPGIFTNKKGADFAAVAGEMAGANPDIPKGGWKNSGFILGRDGLVEWATLDAQYFGIPQRRRRVFIIRDIGNWTGRPPLLLEPESLLGYPAPCREEGQEIAGPLGGSSQSGGFRTTDLDNSGAFIPCWWDGGQVSQTLDAVLYKGQTMPEKNRFPAVLVGIDAPKGFHIAVRRLTPIECEHLQGMPDNHTKINEKTADTPRYKAIGNSFAVPVVRWIGERIQACQ